MDKIRIRRTFSEALTYILAKHVQYILCGRIFEEFILFIPKHFVFVKKMDRYVHFLTDMLTDRIGRYVASMKPNQIGCFRAIKIGVCPIKIPMADATLHEITYTV